MKQITVLLAWGTGILFVLRVLLMPAQAQSSATPTPTGTAGPGSRENPLANPCIGQPFTTVMTGAGLKGAQAIASNASPSQYVVSFTLADNADAQALAVFTASHIGQPLAIVLDGQVISAPIVQAALTTGGEITGNFTREAAEELALQLRYGALPVVLNVVSLEPGIDGWLAVLSAAPGTAADSDKMNRAKQIIEGRANGLGMAPASVSIDVFNEIVVSLPKTVSDPASTINILKGTALLEFVDFSRAESCMADMPGVGEYVLTRTQLSLRESAATPTKTP